MSTSIFSGTCCNTVEHVLCVGLYAKGQRRDLHHLLSPRRRSPDTEVSLWPQEGNSRGRGHRGTGSSLTTLPLSGKAASGDTKSEMTDALAVAEQGALGFCRWLQQILPRLPWLPLLVAPGSSASSVCYCPE